MRLTTRLAWRESTHGSASGLASRLIFVAILVSLLLIFQLDRASGSAPAQHLYYVPIVIAGVSFGWIGGLLGALAAVVLYHSANPQLLTFQYEQWDVVQVAIFIAVGSVTARLTADAKRLHGLAMTDDLTGLHNLRSFEQLLAVKVRSARDLREPMALMVLDLDRLKSLNDAHGHLAGAEAVRTVGHLIAAWMPPGAVACRYGGDEFVVAIPRCTMTEAMAFADRLRRQVHETAPSLAGVEFPAGTLSVSVGIACRVPEAAPVGGVDDAGEKLFRLADAALYEAKERGRNQVHLTA